MAARVNKPNHAEKTKGLIRASQLLNRVFEHGFGNVEMSQTQLQAAKIAIGKYIPDLKAVELTGEGGGPMKFELCAPWLKQTIQQRNSTG